MFEERERETDNRMIHYIEIYWSRLKIKYIDRKEMSSETESMQTHSFFKKTEM
jgi:hypothetical protein